jgi:methylase of polypeptide subunit release factors
MRRRNHILRCARATLGANGVSPREATVLWEHALRDRSKFAALVSRRAFQRVPLQYLVQTHSFAGLQLAMEQPVFIPRPETEQLVDLAVARVRSLDDRARPLRILEVCSGSGAVAVALAHQLRALRVHDVHITAIDANPQAVALGARNAQRCLGRADALGLLSFEAADIFVWLAQCERAFDLVVCNPPYIAAEDIHTLEPEVRLHESHIALDGDNVCANAIGEPSAAAPLLAGPVPPGLRFTLALLEALTHNRCLKQGALVLLELGQYQPQLLRDAVDGRSSSPAKGDAVEAHTLRWVGAYSDFNGIERFAELALDHKSL